VLEEHASGPTNPTCPGATAPQIRPRETMVVVRLDRLARSVKPSAAVIEQLERSGAHFRSLP